MPSAVFVGLTVLDVVSRVQDYPEPNQKVTATRQDVAAGGPAANAAVAFAALGGSATLITYLGSSAMAGIARADLVQHGVTVIDCAGEGFELQVSSITVSEASGDRAIVSTDGGSFDDATIAQDLRERHAVVEALESANAILVDGHHPYLAHAVLALVEGRELPTVADAGRWKPQFESLLPACSHVVASNDFHDPYGWVPESLSDLPNGEQVVVRTRGDQTTWWWSPTSSGAVPVSPIKVVDTLGAGDIFHGAFVHYLVSSTGLVPDQSSALEEIIRAASAVAAVKITHVGTRSWIQQLTDELLS